MLLIIFSIILLSGILINISIRDEISKMENEDVKRLARVIGKHVLMIYIILISILLLVALLEFGRALSAF